MDESFQDSVKISELFNPSILKLEDIFMPYPTNFGNEFNEIRHSQNNDIQSSLNQPNNLSLTQQTNLFFEKNSSSSECKSESTQFSDFQNNLKENIPSQNLQTESITVSCDKYEQVKQQKFEFNEDNTMKFDDFAKIFGPVVSESLDFMSPEDVHSLINKMFQQSQQHLHANES